MGLGHLAPMLPMVRRFRGMGHRVALVVRDLSQVARVFEGLDVEYYQAPVKTTRPENRIETPRSLAHILHNSGYADWDELRAMAAGWRNLYRAIRPDLILCDHAPTAILAAAGTEAVVATIGTGFCCPPDVYPLPDFRTWLPDASAQLQADESIILDNVNRLLRSWNATCLDHLGQLYGRVDECFLATFRELDHYPTREAGRYWGAWPNVGGQLPIWPHAGRGKRVFAYLKMFQALPDLLMLLRQLELPVLVYGSRLDGTIRQRFESATVRFAERRLDLAEIGRQCDLAILNATHGATVSMLLAGKPILQIPLQLEQTLTGIATVRLGAGLSAEPTKPTQIADRLTTLLASDKFAAGAQRFAGRYVDFDGQQQIELVVDRINELLQQRPAARANQASIVKAPVDPNSCSIHPITVDTRAGRNRASSSTIVIGLGTGRCGTKSLAVLLNHQPSTAVGHEMRPLLPWDKAGAPQDVRSRFAMLVERYPQVARVGDVGHFYLPYIPDLFEAFENLRVVCLQRDREETIDSFIRWITATRSGRPVNHWSLDRDGFESDPWDRCFPHYPTRDMAQGIGRYWDDYYREAQRLATAFPEQFRIFPTERSLREVDGIRELLDWVGVPRARQCIVIVHEHRSD